MNSILFHHYAICENYIYFFEGRKSLLGKLNVETGEVSYIQNIKNYCLEDGEDMDFTTYRNGKIYALKKDGTAIVIYNIKENSCECLDLKCNNNGTENFAYMCEYEEKLYVFPQKLDKVFCITKEDELLELPINLSNKIVVCAQIIRNKVYLFAQSSSMMYIYDLRTSKLESCKLNCQVKDVISCTVYMDNIYILCAYGNVFVYQLKKRQVDEIRIIDNKHILDEMRSEIIVLLDSILVFPWCSGDIEIISLKDKSVKVFRDYPKDFYFYKDVGVRKFHSQCENGEYYFLLKYFNYLFKIEKRTGKFIWTKLFKGSKEDELKIALNYGHKNFVEPAYAIREFIGELRCLPNVENAGREKKGRKIWDKLNDKL